MPSRTMFAVTDHVGIDVQALRQLVDGGLQGINAWVRA